MERALESQILFVNSLLEVPLLGASMRFLFVKSIFGGRRSRYGASPRIADPIRKFTFGGPTFGTQYAIPIRKFTFGGPTFGAA